LAPDGTGVLGGSIPQSARSPKRAKEIIMKGIKEIGSYNNPEETGYTEWIKTAAGVYFVTTDTGDIVGPYPAAYHENVPETVEG
jgi:hypothetical protein